MRTRASKRPTGSSKPPTRLSTAPRKRAETGWWWRDPIAWALALWGAAVALLAFPPAGLWPLALLAPAPLWAAAAAPGGAGALRRAFARGWLYGLGFFGALLWWLSLTIQLYGGLPLAAAAACVALLSAYLALYPALVAAAVALASRRSPGHGLLLAPLAWTALEALRGVALTGFPWGDLPQALWRVSWALDLAPWVGIDGVRLLMAALAGAAAWAGLVLRRRGGAGPGRPSWLGLAPAGLCAAAAATLWALPLPPRSDLEPIRVAVVQGNVEQDQKWDPAYRKATIELYRRLSRAASSGAALVVWPETAVPVYFQAPSAERAAVLRLARELGVHLLFGAPAAEVAGDRVELRNAVFLVSPEGRLVGRYDKSHLVPYGEFLPFGRYLPFLGKLVQGVGDFTAGPAPVPLPQRPGLPRLGPLICFELIFPGLAARHAAAGAQMLAVVTNDGWFGDTPGPWQHLAFGAWRAAETGLPLVRAANTGVSAVFDGRGRLLHSTALRARDAFVLELGYEAAPRATPALRVGPWVPRACGALALVGLFAILTGFPHGKRKRGP